jgi:1,2-diacylglycerol 3-beta-glucosyltransferase
LFIEKFIADVLHTILFILAIYLALYVLYSIFLVGTALMAGRREILIGSPKTGFSVIIPAHNEELLLPRLLDSLSKQNYPSYLVKAYVIADNCSDGTARIGRNSGAEVIERFSSDFRGKGYAIRYALESICSYEYDAVFIVDADSIVERNALRNLDLAVQNGKKVIQCYNGVANPEESWFTRLMDVSRAIGNEILGPAKEKIGLSSHLMGNGMCFVRDIISKYGWDAFTVGEDWEYSAKLVLQGERIAFVNKARVYHSESLNLKQATSQRLRWSSGRLAIARQYGSRLLFDGVRSGSLLKFDAALPLLFPNPSLGISLTILMFLICLIMPFDALKGFMIGWFGILGILQLAIFLTGLWYVKNRKKKVLAIFFAPIFLIWKSALDLLSVAGIGRKSWVRTERKL